MARTHGKILTEIWIDPDFRALPSGCQHLYLAFVTSPRLSYAGVLDHMPARFAKLAPDLTVPKITRYLSWLQAKRFVIIDEYTSELLVRTFIRHDGLMAQPNLAKAMAKAYRLIESTEIRAAIVVELRRIHADKPTLPGWGEKGLKEADPDLLAEVQAEPFREPFDEPFREAS